METAITPIRANRHGPGTEPPLSDQEQGEHGQGYVCDYGLGSGAPLIGLSGSGGPS